MNSVQFATRLVLAAIAILQSNQTFAAAFTGAGSTAAAPVYHAWAEQYAHDHDVVLNYQGVGSTAGLQKIRAHEVSFGASDVAPSEADLNKDGLVLVPMFITGAVPVINVPGLPKGQLRLTGEVMGQIYLGSIKTWNAPEIQALNPTLRLPALPIKPIARSDGSGTTYYVTDFLSQASESFKSKFPKPATSIAWPASVTGVKGSDGVATAVSSTIGSIGYIDYNYVIERNLSPVKLADPAGEFVDASAETFSNALRASDWFIKGDFHATLANLPAKQAWPITMGTFVVMQKVSDSADDAVQSLQFFLWAMVKGDSVVTNMSFVHLPDKIQALAYKNMSSISSKDGSPIGLNAIASVIGSNRPHS